MKSTVDGELPLIEHEPSKAFELIEKYKDKVLQELLRTINYLGPSSCVLMQGSPPCKKN